MSQVARLPLLFACAVEWGCLIQWGWSGVREYGGDVGFLGNLTKRLLLVSVTMRDGKVHVDESKST